jgi:ABC-type nitrate/sulfonate/bicarbonate transport system permease component
MRFSLREFNYSGLAALVVCLLIWEVIARANPGFDAYFPPASRVFAALFNLIVSGLIIPDTLGTVMRYARAYLSAAGLAVTLGIILGYSRFIHSLFEVIIEFLRPMPSVATIPVAILFLGVGDPMKVAVATYGATWPILINTIDGVRNIDRTLIYTGRIFGFSSWRMLRKIALPAALPYIVTGLRVSLPIALIAITAAEMIAGGNGLGFFILDEQRAFKIADMYAGIVLVSFLGYLGNRLFLMLETKAMAWHKSLTAREVIV